MSGIKQTAEASMQVARLPEPPATRQSDRLAESNHRIANALAELSAVLMHQFRVIEMGPETIPRELVGDLIRDMAGRIAALGRLHRLLSGPAVHGEVELGALLSEVIDGFDATGLFGDRLHVHLNVEKCQVSADQASMLIQVFAEAATNAVKHAHPSGLPVELSIAGARTPEGDLLLHVADDGVGLPENFDEERDAGHGLRLVRGLVEYAGGRLTLKSDPLGLSLSIELPGAA
jgi:two-component sensor histidine kinase